MRELEGERVRLEFDENREDQFGRLLAYVRVGGGDTATFNETLLSRGYAQLDTVQPNDRYEARFRQAQQQAKSAQLGIWGLPRVQQCQLANLGNGIGEGSPGCDGAAEGQYGAGDGKAPMSATTRLCRRREPGAAPWASTSSALRT